MTWSIRALQFVGIITLAVVVAFLLNLSRFPKTAEAQSSQRFQLQANEVHQGYRVMAVCDTATGTLIYVGDGMAAVPNSCAKNPR